MCQITRSSSNWNCDLMRSLFRAKMKGDIIVCCLVKDINSILFPGRVNFLPPAPISPGAAMMRHLENFAHPENHLCEAVLKQLKVQKYSNFEASNLSVTTFRLKTHSINVVLKFCPKQHSCVQERRRKCVSHRREPLPQSSSI